MLLGSFHAKEIKETTVAKPALVSTSEIPINYQLI